MTLSYSFQILHWFVQMCLGLKHIHDKRVLHRDIKSKVNKASFVAINKLYSAFECSTSSMIIPCYCYMLCFSFGLKNVR